MPKCRGRHEFHHEVAVRDGIHAVGADGGKAQLLGQELTVGRVRHPRQCSAAKGQHVDPLVAVMHPPNVAMKHLKVGQHVMRKENRLRPLKMGIPWHNHALVAPGQTHQGSLHPSQAGHGIGDDLAGVEAHVQGDLVVAGTSGVQPPGRRANEVVQAPLDVHVQVFESGIPREVATLDFLFDRPQSIYDGRRVLLGDDALPGKHTGVGQRPGDVLAVQAPVVVDGYGVS